MVASTSLPDVAAPPPSPTNTVKPRWQDPGRHHLESAGGYAMWAKSELERLKRCGGYYEPYTDPVVFRPVYCDDCGVGVPWIYTLRTNARYRPAGELQTVFNAVVAILKETSDSPKHKVFRHHNAAVVVIDGEGPWSILSRWQAAYLEHLNALNRTPVLCWTCWANEIHDRKKEFQDKYGDEGEETYVSSDARALAVSESEAIYHAKYIIGQMAVISESTFEGLSFAELWDLAATIHKNLAKFAKSSGSQTLVDLLERCQEYLPGPSDPPQ